MNFKEEAIVEIGQKMYESNIQMIKNAIDLRDLEDNYVAAELGHGNGEHVKYVLNQGFDKRITFHQ